MLGRSIVVLMIATAGVMAGNGQTNAATPSKSTAGHSAKRGAIAAESTSALTDHPVGYFWVAFNDPDCPGDPDSFNRMVRYNDANDNYAYDLYAGHSTYCYKGATWEQPWVDCMDPGNPYGCPQLYP